MAEGFPERLADVIRRSGLKKGDVARRVGVTPGTLSGYLAGRILPDRPVLLLLAQVLATTIDFLLGTNIAGNSPAVHRAEKSTAPENGMGYIPDAVALTGLEADDRRTVIRLLHARRAGDAEVRCHLFRGLKIFEHALMARRQQSVKNDPDASS